jgi:hypothetical protein
MSILWIRYINLAFLATDLKKTRALVEGVGKRVKEGEYG